MTKKQINFNIFFKYQSKVGEVTKLKTKQGIFNDK